MHSTFIDIERSPADGTVPSGYINFWPLCRNFVPSAYCTKCSQMGHPVCRRNIMLAYAAPSADGPIWLHFAQSADGASADGTSHLPTFCPICRHFVQSAYWTKCSQMGPPVCWRDKMFADGPSHLPTVPFADWMRRYVDGPEHIHLRTFLQLSGHYTVYCPLTRLSRACTQKYEPLRLDAHSCDTRQRSRDMQKPPYLPAVQVSAWALEQATHCV